MISLSLSLFWSFELSAQSYVSCILAAEIESEKGEFLSDLFYVRM